LISLSDGSEKALGLFSIIFQIHPYSRRMPAYSAFPEKSLEPHMEFPPLLSMEGACPMGEIDLIPEKKRGNMRCP